MLKVLEAVLGRTAYLDLLAEHPDALHQLVRLSAKSPWFGERTARQPLLLDELLDPRRLFEPLHRADLEQELDQLLSGVEAGRSRAAHGAPCANLLKATGCAWRPPMSPAPSR